MLAHLRALWHRPCADCRAKDRIMDDLARQVAYWRTREERAVDRLLAAKGIGPVAAESIRVGPSRPEALIHALSISEIDSSKRTPPGQGSELRGDHAL